MDPISALSVASGVVAFVDFGGKILSRYLELRRSDEELPAAMRLIRNDIEQLKRTSNAALVKVKGLKSKYPTQGESLDRLADHCLDARGRMDASLEELMGILGRSKPEGGRSRAVVAVWSVSKEAEFEKLKQRMTTIREEMMMNVLMCLWDEATQSRERMEGVGSGIKQILDAQTFMEGAVKDLRDDFRTIAAGQPLDTQGGKARLTEKLWNSVCLFDEKSLMPGEQSRRRGTSNLNSALAQQMDLESRRRILDGANLAELGRDDLGLDLQSDFGTHLDDSEVCERLLEDIKFDGMTDRQERIPTPFPDTFSWLFAPQSAQSPTGFTRWLASREDEIPFWITGKPASGKSTLMKFIATHPRLTGLLKEWSGDFNLLTVSIYFWGPGSMMQKSQTGLLRTMLYQLLRQRPDLCRVVVPRRYVLYSLAGADLDFPPLWSLEELQRCLSRFAAEVGETDRVALFVDGLDEYDGRCEELVELLKKLQADHGFKLCVSSRPWNVFSDAFRTSPSLRMEDLTKDDLHIYIKRRLAQSYGFEELRRIYPAKIAELVCAIEDKAQGVFLWVVLVVEQLLQVAQDVPRLDAIWQALDDLPEGLEALYNAIQKSLSGTQVETASKLYQIVFEWKRVWNSRIEAPFLWLAVEAQDPTQPLTYPSVEEEQHILPVLGRLLVGSTKGLLQLSSKSSQKPQVEFLHRTAYDWIRITENWARIVSEGPSGFHPTLSLLAVLVCHYQSGRLNILNRKMEAALYRIFRFASQVDNTTENRARVMTIVDYLDPILINHNTLFSVDGDVLSPDTSTGLEPWAALWACTPYLQARLEAAEARRLAANRARSRLSVSRILHTLSSGAEGGGPERNWLLLAAAHGEDINYDKLSGLPAMSQWQASRRLDSVHLLLQAGCRVDGRLLKTKMKKICSLSRWSLQPISKATTPDSCEPQFRYILSLVVAGSRSVDLEELKRRYLPLIKESHVAEEFPELDLSL
ncbi:hypothetical protein B0T19DRAFT_276585 [Cercophora scortea]|uniref:Nephrocystin 3-like N-terminal domain-containing protein n=1 Tax=Cercophora scortea TaxID=314031 RepID=A0AAE0I939_9PEZI|nr:hypothetical protein B0T19DRAFT_276585 [Cercophora scortea]